MVADGLSRIYEDAVEISAISTVSCDWLKEIKIMCSEDDFFKEIDDKLQQGHLSSEEYSRREGVYYYKGRILLSPNAQDLKTSLLNEHHNSPSAGHSGITRTLHRLRRSFY
ncbi:uncharacterized protein LOC109828155 [Asparagus officinalis]|uniref:uncharacterized protein LOC109828155 n=1 Tax=Asparagus officinalis TaxID=4686 RepID=UPI00098DE9AD|nr:uncharacterized protein LOC109828155 [Asparagus officinalis]